MEEEEKNAETRKAGEESKRFAPALRSRVLRAVCRVADGSGPSGWWWWWWTRKEREEGGRTRGLRAVGWQSRRANLRCGDPL